MPDSEKDDSLAALIDRIRDHRFSYSVHGDELLDFLFYLQRNPAERDVFNNRAHDKEDDGKPETPGGESGSGEASEGDADDSEQTEASSDGDSIENYGSDDGNIFEEGEEREILGKRVFVPTAAALPRRADLAVALKPLQRRVQSIAAEWDIDGMVDRYAETGGMWELVFQKTKRPVAEVVLVAEDTGTIRFWKPLLDEFESMLQRDVKLPVRRYLLETRDEGPPVLTRYRGKSGAPPGILKSPSRRRVILFFSDAISAAWRSGAIPNLLRDWARVHSVTLVPPYHEDFYFRTALADFPLQTARVREKQSATWIETDTVGEIPVFYLPLSASWAASWSATLTHRSSGHPALSIGESIAPAWPPPEEPRPVPMIEDPVATLREFRRSASKATRELARSLAAVPLFPPVMRLVREGLHPRGDHTSLSEFLLSGLIYLKMPSDDPDRSLYEFCPVAEGQRELRDHFLDTDKPEEIEAVWQTVGRHVEYLDQVLGANRGTFAAFLEGDDLSAGEVVNLTVSEKAFAQVRGRVLMRFGGEKAKQGRKLLEQVAEKEPGFPEQVAEPEAATFTAQEDAEAELNLSEEASQEQSSQASLNVVETEGFPNTFLCYSRNDSAKFAERIYQYLSERSADSEIFFADRIVAVGEAWQEHIHRAIDRSAIVLVLIGERFAQEFQSSNYIAMEIEIALAQQKRIIPILINDAVFPSTKELPKAIEALSFLAGFHLRTDSMHFEADLERLVQELRRDETIKNRAPKNEGFTNSLGMPFLPVPGLDGVLFCQWQTRVQDYAAFAAENPGIDMEWKDYEYKGHKQGPDHPVVNVNWEDAVAFCKWLSKKEGKTYRLPSDHEWSMAVGIGDREDPKASPSEKDGKLKSYPWGEQWPPQEGSGNFAGEESDFDWKIEGYRDPYPFTAPVGSFALEHHGLKDLSGNVWEWCQDWYDADKDRRVLRGGSWVGDREVGLRSSCRLSHSPALRDDRLGCRCVVEAG